MRGITKIVAVALAAGALVLGGCSEKKSSGTGNENTIPLAGLRVRVAEAKIGTATKTLRYSGMIKGYREVDLSPTMSSWVEKILVKEGQKVRKGQLLAKLSPEQYKQAKAQFEAARENYRRMKKLYEQGSISKQQFDQVEAGYKAAKAMYELAAKNTELRAPFDGIVAAVNMEEGAMFNAMMSRGGVLTVSDLSKVKIEIGVSDKDVIKIKPGQKVFVHCDAFPDTVFVGKVESVDNVADPLSGTYRVKIVVPNPDEKLRSGMFATVFIVIDEADSALVIPADAVVDDTLVFVAEGNKARARKVKLGVQGDSLVQVIDGIKIGEKVIVEGTLGLYDGAPIIVKK